MKQYRPRQKPRQVRKSHFPKVHPNKASRLAQRLPAPKKKKKNPGCLGEDLSLTQKQAK